jgi:hypothetical protein
MGKGNTKLDESQVIITFKQAVRFPTAGPWIGFRV